MCVCVCVCVCVGWASLAVVSGRNVFVATNLVAHW